MKMNSRLTIGTEVATLVQKTHVFMHPDGVTQITIMENQHGFTFEHLSNAKLTIHPDGTCHDNRFNTLERALEQALETYKEQYGDE